MSLLDIGSVSGLSYWILLTADSIAVTWGGEVEEFLSCWMKFLNGSVKHSHSSSVSLSIDVFETTTFATLAYSVFCEVEDVCLDVAGEAFSFFFSYLLAIQAFFFALSGQSLTLCLVLPQAKQVGFLNLCLFLLSLLPFLGPLFILFEGVSTLVWRHVCTVTWCWCLVKSKIHVVKDLFNCCKVQFLAFCSFILEDLSLCFIFWHVGIVYGIETHIH